MDWLRGRGRRDRSQNTDSAVGRDGPGAAVQPVASLRDRRRDSGLVNRHTDRVVAPRDFQQL